MTTESVPFPKSDGMLSKAADTAHAAVDRASNAADAALKNAGPTLDRAAAKAHHAVDAAANAAASSGDWLEQQTEEMRASGKQAIDRTTSFIAEWPLTSIAIALLAGVIIGRLR